MTSCESRMKGVQQRIDTRERSSADPGITLWFGPLGFRSQPIVAAPLPRPHTHSVLGVGLFTTPLQPHRYLFIGAKAECLQGYGIKEELDPDSPYSALGDIGIKNCPLYLSRY